MQHNLEKDLLFYSSYCDYSKIVLQTLEKNDGLSNFTLICIDTVSSSKLPIFVDRVPLIYTIRNDVLTDETVMKYILNMKNTSNEDIKPYSITTLQNSFSTEYSYLEDGTDDIEVKDKKFTFLGESQIIETMKEEERSNKMSFSSQLESYIAERDKDITKIIDSGR